MKIVFTAMIAASFLISQNAAQAAQKPRGWVAACTAETIGQPCGEKTSNGFWPAAYGTCMPWPSFDGKSDNSCVHGG